MSCESLKALHHCFISFESDSKMCSTRDFEKKMVCEYTTDTRSANHHRDGSHLATDVMLKKSPEYMDTNGSRAGPAATKLMPVRN